MWLIFCILLVCGCDHAQRIFCICCSRFYLHGTYTSHVFWIFSFLLCVLFILFILFWLALCLCTSSSDISVKDIQQGTYMRSLHALVLSSATYGYHTALYTFFNVVSLQLPFLFIPATCTSSNEYLHVTQHKALSTCPNQCMQPVLLTFTTLAQTSFMNTSWEVPTLTV